MINKYAILILAVLLTGIGSAFSQTFTSFHSDGQAGKKYHNEKPRSNGTSAKQIDVTATGDNGYVPGATHNLYFTFIINNTDFEYADSVAMTFPAGMTLNSVSNDDFFGPSYGNPPGPDGDPEPFNGINGQTVSWGDNDNSYGGITSQGSSYSFSINVSFDPGLSGDQTIEVHVSGDEFGDTPGDQDLQIVVSEDADPSAQVQIIHNSADLAAAQVDIRFDGSFPDASLDDLAFRNATSFIDLPAGQEVEVTVNDPGSSDASSPLYSETLTLDPGIRYVVIASGIVSGSGYDPLTPFSFEIFSQALQSASQSGNTDLLVYHGSTDAPTVNISEPVIGAPLITNLSYGEFDGYLSLPTNNYVLEVSTANGQTVQTYAAPLTDLGLADQAATVLASGFLDPASNSEGSEFGLWVALPEGGNLIELSTASYAQVQFIHNCADEVADFVDIRINGELSPILDNFSFRRATPFLALPSDGPMVITVNDTSSTDASDPLYTLDLTGQMEPNAKYILVAEGIISDVGYSPGPLLTPFQLRFIENAREGASMDGNTDVLVLHSSTDAPTVTINEVSVPVPGLVENISYGDTEGYLELATENYALQLINEDNGSEIATYNAPLLNAGLTNSAISVLASGFVSPFDNSDGPGFGLWAALPTGGDLIELGIFAQNDAPCNAFDVEVDGETIQAINSGATVDDGEVVPPNGDCSTFTTWCDGGGGIAQLDNTLWYTFTAPPSGVVELSTCYAGNDFDTQIAVYEAGDCSDYSTFTLLGANDDYDTDAGSCDSPNPYASVLVVCGLTSGETYYVQIDGYNGATGNLEMGITELDALTCSAMVQIVNNAADAATSLIDFRVNGELVAADHDDLAFRTATETAGIPAGGTVTLSVNPSTSVDDSEALAVVEDFVFTPGQSYQIIIQGISSDLGYDPGSNTAPLDLVIIDNFEQSFPNPNNTDVAFVHGSTDAPNIDVDELFQFGQEVFGNIGFNEAQGYVTLPTGNYSLGVTEAGQTEIIDSYYLGMEDLDLGGTAITIFASGFFNPGVNSNGPEFGLWASLPEGGDLIPLQIVTATSEEEVISGMTVYPNPATSEVQIQYNLKEAANLRVDVYDLSGRLVKAKTLGQRTNGLNRDFFDVSKLTSGLYFVNVYVGNSRYTQKLQVLNK